MMDRRSESASNHKEQVDFPNSFPYNT